MYRIIIKKKYFIRQKYHWCLVRNGRILLYSEKYYNLKDVEEVAGHLAKALNANIEYEFYV